MQTITFTTNDQIGQLLHAIATENNKATSEVIADSLRYYSEMLQKRKWSQIKQASTNTEFSPIYQAFEQAGLIGCIETDEQLSTTYKDKLDFSFKHGAVK